MGKDNQEMANRHLGLGHWPWAWLRQIHSEVFPDSCEKYPIRQRHSLRCRWNQLSLCKSIAFRRSKKIQSYFNPKQNLAKKN